MKKKHINKLKIGLLCQFVFLFIFLVPEASFSQRTITVGSTQTYRNNTTAHHRSARLSDDKVLLVYADGTGNDDNKYAIVGTVNSVTRTITWGTPLTLGSGLTAAAFDVVALSSSKAVVIVEEPDAQPDETQYIVLDIDGTTISKGSITTFGSDYISWNRSYRITALNSNTVVVCYEDGGDSKLYAMAGTVSGTTISWGAAVEISTNDNTAYASICRLSNAKFAIAWEDDFTSPDSGKVRVCTLSGTTITPGVTTTTFGGGSQVGAVAVTALSEDNLAIVWEDDADDDNPTIRYFSVSGTTVTALGTATVLSLDDVNNDIEIAALSSTEAVVVMNAGSGNTSNSFLCTLSGETFTVTSSQIHTDETEEVEVAALTSDLYVVSYFDDNNTTVPDRGDAKVFTLSAGSNPEINVQGNSTDIELGDSSPTTTDHTDFGTGYGFSRTFTIQNTGSGTLTLGSNAVTISGTNASDFSVTSQPATTVSGSSTTTFTVQFKSVTESARTALVSINSDDIHEPNYFFSIQGTGQADGVWSGSSGSDWNTAGNWADNAVPNSSTDINIPSGLSNFPVISTTTSASCNNLTIESGASLTIESDASNTGSLIVSGTSAGNITVERYMTGDGNTWHLTGVPVVGQGINDLVTSAGNSFATNDVMYGLGVYNEGDDSWITYTETTAPEAGNLIAGVGYETNRSTSGDITYVGTLTVAQVDVPIVRTTNGWNLLGNPYPCSINANSTGDVTNNFLTVNEDQFDNTGSYVALYVWNSSSSQYDILNHSSTGTPYIPNGQAFFVKSKSGGGTMSFTTAMRTHQTGATFKSGTANPNIILKADNGESTRSTEFRFVEGTSLGLDPGYDAGLFNGKTDEFKLCSRLMQDNGIGFALQCFPTDDFESVTVPIELKSTSSTVEFSVESNNLPSNIKVYLEDKQDNSFNLLNEDQTYTAEVNIGENSGRFYLHTSLQALDQLSELTEGEYDIVPNLQNSSLTIKGVLGGEFFVKVYDISGKLVFEKQITSNEVFLPYMGTGIYVVKLIGEGVSYSQKVNWIK